MGEIVGYARVSTTGQKLTVQVQKLTAYGVSAENLYQEKFSGAKGGRPELEKALAFVRRGDILVVTRLDRLARSTTELLRIHEILKNKQVELVALDQSLDSTTPQGRFMLVMLGAVAELEREMIRERTEEGKILAAQRGITAGRKSKLSTAQMIRLVEEYERHEISRADLAKKYKIALPSLYRLVQKGKIRRGLKDALPGQCRLFDAEEMPETN